MNLFLVILCNQNDEIYEKILINFTIDVYL